MNCFLKRLSGSAIAKKLTFFILNLFHFKVIFPKRQAKIDGAIQLKVLACAGFQKFQNVSRIWRRIFTVKFKDSAESGTVSGALTFPYDSYKVTPNYRTFLLARPKVFNRAENLVHGSSRFLDDLQTGAVESKIMREAVR